MSTVEELTARVASYVGGMPVTDFLTQCVTEADEMITHHIGEATVPASVKNRAIMEVAAELYHRKSAPNGIKNFADGLDGTTAIRVARDALVAARPLLAPYLPVVFA